MTAITRRLELTDISARPYETEGSRLFSVSMGSNDVKMVLTLSLEGLWKLVPASGGPTYYDVTIERVESS